MSQARHSMTPDENGMFRVWCTPCDMEGEFPTDVMAIQARKNHICFGEALSAADTPVPHFLDQIHATVEVDMSETPVPSDEYMYSFTHNG